MSPRVSIEPSSILNRLIVDKATFNCQGKPVEVTGTISPIEAQYLSDMIIQNEFCTCLETGVAFGGSTVAICAALSQLEGRGKQVKHYGVDPCQFDTYGGPAIAALRECDLDHIFELCEGPSHLMLPELIGRGVTIDFAFIDGMHTFDYTVIDLFFADKLLRKGGIICIHDMELPSKRKAFRYLLGHRKYSQLSGLEEQFSHRVRNALRHAVKAKPRASWNVLTSMGSIGVARKIESYEPNWDFYVRF